MTGFDKVFIDTAPFIYFLERNDVFVGKVTDFFGYCIDNDKLLVTSTVALEEFAVGPYKNDDEKLIDDFQAFLKDTGTTVVSIDEDIAYEAARIRAKYTGFKGMDALQLACAVVSGCDLILTNDIQLRQFEEVPCILLDELEKAQKKHTN